MINEPSASNADGHGALCGCKFQTVADEIHQDLEEVSVDDCRVGHPTYLQYSILVTPQTHVSHTSSANRAV